MGLKKFGIKIIQLTFVWHFREAIALSITHMCTHTHVTQLKRFYSGGADIGYFRWEARFMTQETP